MPTFEQYQSVNLAPGWLQDPWGTAFNGAIGKRKDAAVDMLKEAAKSDLPGVCPSDALALLGTERGIDRGKAEAEGSYRDRVRAAWDTWRWAGTPYGVLLAFYWAGYRPTSGKVVIQTQGDATAGGYQYELRSDFDPAIHAPEVALTVTSLGVVHLGGTPSELWQDFAVLFIPPVLPDWLSSMPGDSSAEVDTIRTLITRWKAGHSRCVRLRAATVDLWDLPIETWDPTTEVWDETGVATDWTPPAG